MLDLIETFPDFPVPRLDVIPLQRYWRYDESEGSPTPDDVVTWMEGTENDVGHFLLS